MSIKDNIRKLNFQYSKSKLRSSLELSGCSLNFLKETKIKTLPESAQFIELSAKTKIAEKDKTSSKIELDLPLGITLRIFI
jgi:hypothetical protein